MLTAPLPLRRFAKEKLADIPDFEAFANVLFQGEAFSVNEFAYAAMDANIASRTTAIRVGFVQIGREKTE